MAKINHKPNITPQEWGRWVTSMLHNRGLTHREFATAIAVTERAIRNWVSGKHLPQPTVMETIATYLGLTLEELYTEVTPQRFSLSKSRESFVDFPPFKQPLPFWCIVGSCIVFFLLLDYKPLTYGWTTPIPLYEALAPFFALPIALFLFCMVILLFDFTRLISLFFYEK